MKEERDSKISTNSLKQTDHQMENVEDQKELQKIEQFINAFEAFLDDC